MENYENPTAQIDANARPVKESRRKRIHNEVNGRSERYYKHQMSPLLCKSYTELNGHPDIGSSAIITPNFQFDGLWSELGVFFGIGAGFDYGSESILFKLGVSALEFDTKIACASFRSTQLRIIDIEQSREVQVLWKSSNRETVELSDIAFLNDGMRVLASDTRGVINMWDRRANIIPQRLLTTKKITGLTSIQILGDHCVYGAATTGFIYVWDLRRMRSSPAASLSDWEIHSIPLTSMDLEYLMKQINPRKTRRDRRPKELHAININPSCPYQLAFHLDNGWDSHAYGRPISYSRRPSWLPEHSDGSLLTVSQKHIGKKGDGDNDHDVEQS
ncbi:uncharacterized protein LOC143571726 [Bidens hawaiensis]|uniref:uncharacterized protein LOC143571726 n=1 Tax=Bidens hawaiensis TaxID=980011 RepID=UPI0040496662